MRVRDITQLIENVAPLAYQEDYDNAGLLVGSPNSEVTGVLLCLDATEAVIDEAIEKGCNLVIAHHPIIFKGLKKLNGKNYVERVVIKAIQHHIAIYAAHTNLDNVLRHGVNEKIAHKLHLQHLRILQPKPGLLRKLAVFCPDAHADQVRSALFSAGAGHIGNYDSCSYNLQGTGTFKALEGSQPFVGTLGEVHHEPETRIEVVFPAPLERQICQALAEAHPYEEPAYDIYSLEQDYTQAGAGIIGKLAEPLSPQDFLAYLKKKLKITCIRYTKTNTDKVQTIAVCGGAGSFLIGKAKAEHADVLVTADVKYHEFFDGEDQLMIADIGHYESEIFTLEIFDELIRKKLGNFAILFTGVHTNPVNYYC